MGKIYQINADMAALASRYATIQLLNPAASGKVCVIHSIRAHNTSGNQHSGLRRHDTLLTGTGLADCNIFNPADLTDTATVMTHKNAQEVSVLGTALLRWYASPGLEVMWDVWKKEFGHIILQEGQGIILVAEAQQQSWQGSIIYEEEG